jgi:deazaflavin-dependent oxidoreductase (nitroreductase family)
MSDAINSEQIPVDVDLPIGYDGEGIRPSRWSIPFPNIRWLLVLITALHRWLYLSTGGRVGHCLGAKKFLLLTHTGRKTGRRYVVPLLYIDDDERFIVVASNAGDERDPDWLLNLQSRSEAQIQVGGDHFPVEARRASPSEGRWLWPRLIQSYRSFTRYREHTRREIPIVVLERPA